MKRAQITQDRIFGTALDRLIGARGTSPVKDETAESIKPPMIKLSVFLNQEEDAYLEGLAASAKFSGGRKISKTKLIEAMVRSFSQTKLDVRGVRDQEDLLRRINAQMRKRADA
jgi:hypothetical protein